ncbi:carbon monoxide dehydrogenase subunit G [Cytobacillus sp. FSL R7-0696]|uniref:SRPBCC family protein n=1 Tax=Cytobacillus sp. FSL R7-0696 TaxID=2921691 RepID=UPI0030FD1CD0
MILSGQVKMKKNYKDVWDALHNPQILEKAIPGCKSLVLKEDGTYDVEMKFGIASVKGDYKGNVKLEDIEAPVHYQLIAEGSGKPGFVKAKMDCYITAVDEEKCEVKWECDAEVGGMIAGVGSRVMSGVAKFIAGNFFKDVEKQITLQKA